MAHVHEGIRLADKSGWVGIGETLNEDVSRRSQVNYSQFLSLEKISVSLGPGEAD